MIYNEWYELVNVEEMGTVSDDDNVFCFFDDDVV